jgi:hypothetical protein
MLLLVAAWPAPDIVIALARPPPPLPPESGRSLGLRRHHCTTPSCLPQWRPPPTSHADIWLAIHSIIQRNPPSRLATQICRAFDQKSSPPFCKITKGDSPVPTPSPTSRLLIAIARGHGEYRNAKDA